MGVYDNAQKVPTGVQGLDALFYDGLQLQKFSDNTSATANQTRNEEKGLIIVLRGERGINKMRLAMQMLHGISKSIYDMDGFKPYASKPYFFSLNKNKDNLSDLFIDYLITRQIEYIIKENARKLHKPWLQDLLSKSLFKLDVRTEQSGNDEKNNLPKDFHTSLDKYLCERTIYYNNRTNALHFLREHEGDDNNNLLFHRRSDNLHDYCANKKEMLRHLPKEIQDEFFDVNFNIHEKDNSDGKDGGIINPYPNSASQKFQDILKSLEEMERAEIEEREEYNKKNGGDKDNTVCISTFEEHYSPCIVIDGFSQLTSDELRHLHFPHIEKVLRRLAMVSILVFDERAKDISCNADIIIDMRVHEHANEGYIFHELQISKSVFQPAAFGWHKYKVRNCGIEVYPSIHRLLQRRNYMSQILNQTHDGILEEGYGRYMRTEQMRYRNYIEPDLSHSTYISKKYDREMELLKEMFQKSMDAKRRFQEKDYVNIDDADAKGICEYAKHLLDLTLLGSERGNEREPDCLPKEDNGMHAQGYASRWREYKPTTALIGNPNSFKRFLTIANIFKAAKNKEHTLVILFDKESDDMRRQFACPGADFDSKDSYPCFGVGIPNSYVRTCSTCHFKCKLKDCCHKCYQYIHFLNVRMGCLSAEELFSVLNEQMNIPYRGETGEKRLVKIVIDDLQKIDYSFPLLREERLFLTALVTLCRKNDVELQILCDKKAELTKELCSLVDNVICIQREEHDTNNITLFVERLGEHISPSEIHKFEIPNVPELFECNNGDFRLNAEIFLNSADMNESGSEDSKQDENKEKKKPLKVRYERIGSMRSYWRKRVGVLSDADRPE